MAVRSQASSRPASGSDDDSDHPKEACGVFAVRGEDLDVSRLTYLGLFALQHRGQEAAGMAVSDGDGVIVVSNEGLVSSVFDETTLDSLTGHVAIGHCRYSTTGSSTWRNAQPSYRAVEADDRPLSFALAHNGNLVNTAALAEEAGMLQGTATSDTDVVAELVAEALRRHASTSGSSGEPATDNALEMALAEVLPLLQGAFSFVAMDEQHIIGVRDPRGFRPLCLGRLGDPANASAGDGWVLASETPALDIVGAEFVREIAPGEMVVIDADGLRTYNPFPQEQIDPRLCLFEFVYFARPDSRLYGRSVHQARIAMGEQLAEQAPVPEADMVMGVPESGVPAAEGFARRSGITFGQGLVKNRYIGRTFIAPTQQMRAEAVRMKLNPLRENIAGKRLVVVDDSIVRGTTQRQLVRMLREAGAREVHLRITSPPVKWSCFFGIDTGDRSELLAPKLSVDEIQEYFEVDSLAYLELKRLVEATGVVQTRDKAWFCDACFTGDYPVEVPVTLGKHVLEVSS